METWHPHPYQKGITKSLLTEQFMAILAEPGLGKTSPTLDAIARLRRAAGARKAGKALVVCPLRVGFNVWTHAEGGELAKWENFAHLREVMLHDDADHGDKERALRLDADLYVINFDGLPWLVACRQCGHSHVGRCREGKGSCGCTADDTRLGDLMAKGVDTLVIDELSKFKHTGSKRFKLVKPHLERFTRRWGLTGSPAANGLLDLFGQMYVIDGGASLGEYVTHYRLRYFMPTGYGGYTWVPRGPETKAEIYRAMSRHAVALEAKDYLKDLPELVERNIWVTLPDAAREVYDDMWSELVAQVEGGTVVAKNAGVASVKCRQVASGGLWVTDEPVPGVKPQRRLVELHDEKTDALEDLVEELQGQPLLVAYQFDHDLKRIRDRLGEVPAINGQTTAREGQEIAVRWNKGKIPVLAGHPAAMGHGLNLQGAGCHVCFYSPTWNFEEADQTVRRVFRQGNKHETVFVDRILARKTVDEAIARALATKEKGQRELFRALKELARDHRPGVTSQKGRTSARGSRAK